MQPTEFFIDYDKLSAKFTAKDKGLWEQKKIMIKTNKTEGLTLSETKSYYKATLMQKKKSNHYEKGMRINNPMEQSRESRKNYITEE